MTNVVDIEKRQVTWNHNGRGKATLDLVYRKLGKKGCTKIEAVASDGARAFNLHAKDGNIANIIFFQEGL